MDRVNIYEYDRKNRERITEAIEQASGQIISWSFFAKEQKEFKFAEGTKSVYIDLSSLFYSEDRADALIAPAELMLNVIQKEQTIPLYVIIERQYSRLLSFVGSLVFCPPFHLIIPSTADLLVHSPRKAALKTVRRTVFFTRLQFSKK